MIEYRMEPMSPASHLMWPLFSFSNKVFHFLQMSMSDIVSDSIEEFTICLTWQRQKSDLYYLINTSSGMGYNQTSTELCLTAEYNTPLQVSVVAVNCT
ncbi:hypothetical protein GBAR_LOCUS4094, partial [Geodia barretti]